MTVKQVMGGGMSVGAAAAAHVYSGMMGLPGILEYTGIY